MLKAKTNPGLLKNMCLWQNVCKMILDCFFFYQHFQSEMSIEWQNRLLWMWQYFTLVIVRIAEVRKWNVWWVALKLSIMLKNNVQPTLNPTLNPNNSVNKCNLEIKKHLLQQPCYFTLLLQVFELVFECRNFCFNGLVPKSSTSKMQWCTRCATKQVYYVRKAIHTVGAHHTMKCQNVLVCNLYAMVKVFWGHMLVLCKELCQLSTPVIIILENNNESRYWRQ